MFYNKKARILTIARVSDGMGGWEDSGKTTLLAEIRVVKSPVSADLALREYGIVTTTSMKLFTEDDIPEGDVFINFEDKDYRILQTLDYGSEKGLLLEKI